MRGQPPASDDLETVILRRGSTRIMDPDATVERDAFDFSLAASLRGSRVPHFVAVHAVEGLDPGLYRWPDLDRPLRRGPLREELLRACWDQDLGRDAAFVVMSAIDLDRSTTAATAKPSSTPASSPAAFIWPPTRSGSARRG